MNESKSLAKITVFWRVRLQNATWPYFPACKFTSDNRIDYNFTSAQHGENCVKRTI